MESNETVKRLKKKQKTCFLCKLIVRDFKKNGKLTNEPLDYNGAPIFPKEGKVRHLFLEEIPEKEVKHLTS